MLQGVHSVHSVNLPSTIIGKAGYCNNCVRLCSHYTGSILGPVRKSIQYNVKSARGNLIRQDRSGVEVFTPYRIDMLHICFGLAKKKPGFASKRLITRFCSKNGVDVIDSPFTSQAESSKKPSDTACITFSIGAFQVIIVTKIVSDQLDQV